VSPHSKLVVLCRLGGKGGYRASRTDHDGRFETCHACVRERTRPWASIRPVSHQPGTNLNKSQPCRRTTALKFQERSLHIANLLNLIPMASAIPCALTRSENCIASARFNGYAMHPEPGKNRGPRDRRLAKVALRADVLDGLQCRETQHVKWGIFWGPEVRGIENALSRRMQGCRQPQVWRPSFKFPALWLLKCRDVRSHDACPANPFDAFLVVAEGEAIAVLTCHLPLVNL
jgi:hypothetical protein